MQLAMAAHLSFHCFASSICSQIAPWWATAYLRTFKWTWACIAHLIHTRHVDDQYGCSMSVRCAHLTLPTSTSPPVWVDGVVLATQSPSPIRVSPLFVCCNVMPINHLTATHNNNDNMSNCLIVSWMYSGNGNHYVLSISFFVLANPKWSRMRRSVVYPINAIAHHLPNGTLMNRPKSSLITPPIHPPIACFGEKSTR